MQFEKIVNAALDAAFEVNGQGVPYRSFRKLLKAQLAKQHILVAGYVPEVSSGSPLVGDDKSNPEDTRS